MIDLKKRKEDGTLAEPEAQAEEESRASQTQPPHQTKRAEIEATLLRLRGVDHDHRRRESEAHEAQRDATRSLVKLMHLDTIDQRKIAVHAANVALQNEIEVILGKMRRLEDRYQEVKKSLAAIPDRTEKHHQLQLVKKERDEKIAPLRNRLKELNPDARPLSSFQKDSDALGGRLPLLPGAAPPLKVSSSVYKKTTDHIRQLQRARRSMEDPYAANLKMAKLWSRINEHERALENYEKALKSLSEKETASIPSEDIPRVLENERRRKREALQFLFLRSLSLKERAEAARLMKLYLELSTLSERLDSASYLEFLLRKEEYVEDPSLSSPEAVTQSILSLKGLGPLTDLRFDLLQELLVATPSDPYLLEAVANLHVRKSDYKDAKPISDRFVALPDVKRLQLFASFAEYRPASPSAVPAPGTR